MSRFRPLPLEVRAHLFQHLAAMEKAGVAPDRAYALLDLGPGPRQRVQAFQRLISRGIDPPTAGANSGLFTVFETRLLRAAFSAGSPLPTYQRLAASLASAARQRATLRARLAMPVAVLVIALLVGPIPMLALGTLSAGGYLWRVLAPLAVLALAAAGAVRVNDWFASGAEGAARPAVERALLGLPLFGALHLRRNMRDFVESLALLLAAGLPMFEALPVALETVDNRQVRAGLGSLQPALKRGLTLAQAVGTLRLADTAHLFALVHTGEQSGSLAEMLARHAAAESEALERAQLELMTWLPRIAYGCVALWMLYQLLSPKL